MTQGNTTGSGECPCRRESTLNGARGALCEAAQANPHLAGLHDDCRAVWGDIKSAGGDDGGAGQRRLANGSLHGWECGPCFREGRGRVMGMSYCARSEPSKAWPSFIWWRHCGETAWRLRGRCNIFLLVGLPTWVPLLISTLINAASGVPGQVGTEMASPPTLSLFPFSPCRLCRGLGGAPRGGLRRPPPPLCRQRRQRRQANGHHGRHCELQRDPGRGGCNATMASARCACARSTHHAAVGAGVDSPRSP
jgi:hypothetical protein